ncbi:hypothetical protein PUNSTDRAFT_124197 [Punctularia strigosozonata HHB-11173 SS5]|uniref:uncharacterized protein n=1 Tax=Punctularia strigosozonata (strain HHB-11173) TaxID=741275 RepID=UPI00044171B5|nr:uncharacterized protein PUNSTDRAFT_124197 [Punctularia strigosozonata HHB-11173 SS5]EIN12200.1 hypothetical protein PUNSTDRAFT_124197 [Punctularia strigosozonata HHB-11173 SS5]
MSSQAGRLFIYGRRALLASAAAGGAYATILTPVHADAIPTRTSAEEQFACSSKYKPPSGFAGQEWRIRNDYPEVISLSDLDAPWSTIDWEKEPERFIECVKQYCLEGMAEVDFVPQFNKKRNWYHAAWMHYGPHGREPCHGLTMERATPSGELSEGQKDHWLQAWAVGFYNAPGATLFAKVWKDPNNPQWNDHLKFPHGTMVYKMLFTNATEEEVPLLKGAPTWDAMIVEQPDPTKNPEPGNDPAKDKRNQYTTPMRLVQMDFAVRDDRAPVGWVFGTFMFDGSRTDINPWYRLTPVGIQWGNDPALTQKKVDEEHLLPRESWVNPVATKKLEEMKGFRPFWGWNRRLNGPADNFMSSCVSCHATAGAMPDGSAAMSMVPPNIARTGAGMPGRWEPVYNTKVPPEYKNDPDAYTMKWFENVPAGSLPSLANRDAVSGDYSLQLAAGWQNYKDWQRKIHLKNRSTLRAAADTVLATVMFQKKVSVQEMYNRSGPDTKEAYDAGPSEEDTKKD